MNETLLREGLRPRVALHHGARKRWTSHCPAFGVGVDDARAKRTLATFDFLLLVALVIDPTSRIFHSRHFLTIPGPAECAKRLNPATEPCEEAAVWCGVLDGDGRPVVLLNLPPITE